MKSVIDTFFPDFNLYTYMAHSVGRELGIRPSSILDEWGVPELIVAWGQYSDEDTYRNYKEWEDMSKDMKKGIKPPKKWAVQFYSHEKLNELAERKS